MKPGPGSFVPSSKDGFEPLDVRQFWTEFGQSKDARRAQSRLGACVTYGVVENAPKRRSGGLTRSTEFSDGNSSFCADQRILALILQRICQNHDNFFLTGPPNGQCLYSRASHIGRLTSTFQHFLE